jgi:hypothetical protein
MGTPAKEQDWNEYSEESTNDASVTPEVSNSQDTTEKEGE